MPNTEYPRLKSSASGMRICMSNHVEGAEQFQRVKTLTRTHTHTRTDRDKLNTHTHTPYGKFSLEDNW
jgi:hypothetical protein